MFSPMAWLACYYALGCYAYALLEDWAVSDSVYFMTVTLTTVGFGDIAPRSAAGRALTAVLTPIGIALLLGALLPCVPHVHAVRKSLERTVVIAYTAHCLPQLRIRRPRARVTSGFGQRYVLASSRPVGLSSAQESAVAARAYQSHYRTRYVWAASAPVAVLLLGMTSWRVLERSSWADALCNQLGETKPCLRLVCNHHHTAHSITTPDLCPPPPPPIRLVCNHHGNHRA